ncbi:arabinan endo-1,5-alpha-L-arabinosidase [Chitinophagaceae bacterium LB-8]|uniref:Arabinan endo-1,5-alpha-L-arabinosidase n=1 Tax=Paraflavisolibacter caeni TaxID=2982496 RepID=A0A9X2XWI1_9BACT|nr:arabinan endo-1,5-alpha-L-arabinosidase [Paraflavisolibacter caeni]MCU7549797.1 arabinan endo-1,5-alpha-L-arabinosidase [Paraflavisolibacter caeni]
MRIRLLSIKSLPIILAGLMLVIFAGCSKKDEETTSTPTVDPPIIPPVSTFAGPTYADNYTSISAWASRSQWNLANVHDPTVEKCSEYYYMYQTDASYGNVHEGQGHYPYRRSKDLVNWEFMGMAFSTVPAWVKDSLNNKRARMSPALPPIENPSYGFWAPHIKKVGNKYRLYYSVVVTNPIVGTDPNTSWTERAFIGLAESDDLATNQWVDKGMVVCSEPDGVRSYTRNGANDWSGYFKFNAIDPTFIVTPEGEHWLIYGSWHSGIAALKLNPATGKPDKLETIDDYGVRIAGRGNVNTNRWQALEGPEIIYNQVTGYYYLFLAYDELSIAYNTRVARSRNITGPYVGIDGASVTTGAECWPMLTHPYAFSGHTGWVGISHCSIFQNPDTKEWFYASQGRLPENVPGINVSNAVMMGHVRQIHWTEDGWPVIAPERYAGVPKTTIKEEYIPGTWEQITMQYQYKVIQQPITMLLTIDKKVSGGVTGTWSLDTTKGILTINNIKYNLSNAWNWESVPRKVTVTYSGLTLTGRPIWAKKVQ